MENFYCVLPFIHLHINNLGLVTPCCINHVPLGNAKEETIEAIWTGPNMERFRQAMKEGKKMSGCETCYDKEMGGVTSLRLQYNRRFKKYHPETNERVPEPIYFDVRFSNLCNLKCRTCWHGASSLWFDDAQVLGGGAGKEALIKAEGQHPLIPQLQKFLGDAEEIYFAGGEPLIMEEHYQVLQLFIEKKRTDVYLRYNTNFMNLGLKKYDLFELWSQFKDISVSISIDDVLGRDGYIRKGSSYDKLLRNRELLRTRCPHVEIFVSPTVSILNIFTLCETLKTLVNENFVTYDQFYINILNEPRWYNIKLLPAEQKKIVSQRFDSFIASENIPESLKNDLLEIISFMYSEDWSHYFYEFIERNQQLDDLRGESFVDAYKSDTDLIRLYEIS